jgi:hypothetical protein
LPLDDAQNIAIRVFVMDLRVSRSYSLVGGQRGEEKEKVVLGRFVGRRKGGRTGGRKWEWS